jgi:hypothetical protein
MKAAVSDDFVSFSSGLDAQSAHEKYPGKNLDTCLFVLYICREPPEGLSMIEISPTILRAL